MPYFLSKENIDHEGEIFNYIQELHEILWQFVRIAKPKASGNLKDHIDSALEILKEGRTPLRIVNKKK